ncbi:MAG: universal stress protein [Nitrososphaerales archaeon]
MIDYAKYTARDGTNVGNPEDDEISAVFGWNLDMSSWTAPKNVLVAVDTSENSQRALDFAIAFSKAFSARLTIVSVVENPGFVELDEPTMSKTVDHVVDSYKEKQKSQVSLFLNDALTRAKGAGVNASLEVLNGTGSVAEEISKYAIAQNIELIVVGSRGQSGLKKLLTGSVSSGIVSHSQCTVVVVR